jgi:ParB/RepB/Spo0J family partition protein
MTVHAEAPVEYFPIDQIIVDEKRQREGIGGGKKAEELMAELMRSIDKNGLLNPPVIDADDKLVAGYRRLTACKRLEWANIPVRRSEALTDLQREEMELDENIQRQDLTWQERAAAIARIHEIKTAEDPNWSQIDTATVVGKERQQVRESIGLVSMMKHFPELAKAKNMFQAVNQMKSLAKSVLRVQEVKENPVDYGRLEEKLWLGDSVELIKTIPDESFHHIVTDPPFGIDFDSRISDGTDAITQYKDSAELYRGILGMAPDLYRVLKPNGFCIWFLGITWYEEAKETFRKAGFTVDEIPIFWDRSGGRTFTRRPDRYFNRGYDIALHCLKGDAELTKRGRSNVFRFDPVPADEAEQSVERPIELYAELINYISRRGEIIADFFAGSGSCSAAAAIHKRDFFAIEKDPVRRARALKKIQANLPDGTQL